MRVETQNKKWSLLVTNISEKMRVKHFDGAGSQSGDEIVFDQKSVGFSAAMDFLTDRLIGFRGVFDYESFSGKDSQTFLTCPSFSETQCDVNISYLGLGLFSRLNLNQSPFQYWFGLGVNLKYPLSKKASALAESDIGTTSSYSIAVGADFSINSRYFIPVSLEQQFFLNSESVHTEMTIVKVGFGNFF